LNFVTVNEFLDGDDRLRVARMRAMHTFELDVLLANLTAAYHDLDPRGTLASIDPSLIDRADAIFCAGRLIHAELVRRGV
jgi:hypothetical protein